MNLEECTPCYTNQVLETDGTLDMDGEDHDTCANNSERINVLDHPNMTNVSMQVGTWPSAEIKQLIRRYSKLYFCLYNI